MPSSISSISTSSSYSSTATVSSTRSDIDHLAPIIPYLKLSKSQKGVLTTSKNLSENWKIATDGAIIMALRKERIEKQKRKEKEQWLRTYRKGNPMKGDEDEEGGGGGEEEGKTLEPGWLSKILDKKNR
ncbi:hypothetical protein TWF106_010734 [Orbilia oligospora]|uniref:Uncharacterized protein n=1 Tax=Orbilia oligospora TaxID=2813651 RepID=A0A6G1MR11_ORBOL|nr:hypothetical protein TWF106_010734 [Orbilia oligospora]KAF3212896.1 hypothetical protein TWF191_010374 [Orbilia oligospora]KAF3220803.1 hypothetical protein TWF679_008993 [Orbilia oligospora]KAF3265612.1 hypothetical protein TWF192_000258 [Orbilia oligospora]